MKFTPYPAHPELTPAFVAQVLHMVFPIGRDPYVFLHQFPAEYHMETMMGQHPHATFPLRRQEIQIGRIIFAVWIGRIAGNYFFTYASQSDGILSKEIHRRPGHPDDC